MTLLRVIGFQCSNKFLLYYAAQTFEHVLNPIKLRFVNEIVFRNRGRITFFARD